MSGLKYLSHFSSVTWSSWTHSFMRYGPQPIGLSFGSADLTAFSFMIETRPASSGSSAP